MDVQGRFDQEMLRIYQEAAKFGYRPTRFLEMVNTSGGVATAQQLLRKGPSDGFTRLWAEGRLDLSVEAMVLQERWAPLFTAEDLETARARLEEAGYQGQPVAPPQTVEGAEDNQELSWGDYPIDALLIRNEQCQVQDAVRRINRDQFVMDPDFQRDFIWDESKQSKLVESVMMRIPLPVFYLAEDYEGRKIVVDGLQRLSTFQRFLSGDLRLRLPDRPELDGKRFQELEDRLQIRFEDFNLTLYVIDARAPERARMDIFERVNSGMPLTRQQMRNCLHVGDATRFLRAESKRDLFIEATGRSLSTDTMRDREFVNRFCAFQILGLEQYRDMDQFLADCLTKMNKDPQLLPSLSEQLETALTNNINLFGRHAFRKHEAGQYARSVINASLWDVLSTGLSRYPPSKVNEKKEAVKKGFYRLLDDGDFWDSITYGTNGVRQVRSRFAMANGMLAEVLDA